MDTVGLIAGNRKFPLLFAQAARRHNCRVVAIAIKGDTSRRINQYADTVYWLGLSEFSRMFAIFRREGVERVVMAGQISPRRLFSKEILKDEQLRHLLSTIQDQRADTIFGAIADKLEANGCELVDSTLYLKEYLPARGLLTSRQPEEGVWEDISFGLMMAKNVASLDIGQTVAVKNKAVVAVEALEGTDNLIRRAGRIARGGITVVKVSKPRQDIRFDVPVVGLNTVKTLIRARGRCLALEAEKTLFIDKDACLALAERHKFTIVSS